VIVCTNGCLKATGVSSQCFYRSLWQTGKKLPRVPVLPMFVRNLEMKMLFLQLIYPFPNQHSRLLIQGIFGGWYHFIGKGGNVLVRC